MKAKDEQHAEELGKLREAKVIFSLCGGGDAYYAF